MKVQSQNDHVKLDLIKDQCYNESFYKGVMIVGDWKGKSVQDAKPAIKKWMIEQGMALSYNEPEKEVISRSGVECVVALTDQWYLNYGEPTWRDEIQAHLEKGLETYNPQTHKKFGEIIGWLKEWACSRSYVP
jgi:leucyl-tRNA synthetase